MEILLNLYCFEASFIAETNGFKIKTDIITQIRFPRKGVSQYMDLLKTYGQDVIEGYEIEIKEDESFIF